MESAEGSPCSSGKSPHNFDPNPLQVDEDVDSETCITSDEETSASEGPATPVGQQNRQFLETPIKAEPDDEDDIGAGASTSVEQRNEGLQIVKVEELEDYLYCEACKSFFINKCEVHGPPVFIPDTPVPMGVADRARRTLLPGLEVRESGIPDAGLGVFNNGETVPVGAHFGPYEGEPVDREQAIHSGYSWVIYNISDNEEYIDAKKETHANWMRYVNCARTDQEQNLVAFQYRGGIYYRCCRAIEPGQELLLWYEDGYAEDIGITFDYIWNKKSSSNEESEALSRAFLCSLCPLSYTSQNGLYKHIKRCHHERSGETEYQTPVPTTSFSGQQALTGVLSDDTFNGRVQSDVHQVLDCVADFTKQVRLQLHQRIHNCSHCGKTFSREDHLQRHERVHTGEKPFHCSDCGKSFSGRGTLQRHQRIHTGERPYHCLQCGKSFGREYTLQLHQRIHTGEKPYPCSLCGKRFTRQCDFKVHLRIHTGQKPYHCSRCGKSFNNKSNLQLHERIHTGEKPYQCSQCSKRFTQLDHLKVHQRLHTGQKPYNCSYCGRSFTQLGHLQSHQRIHTGEKPYYCSQCGCNFTHSKSLKKHKCTNPERTDMEPLSEFSTQESTTD